MKWLGSRLETLGILLTSLGVALYMIVTWVFPIVGLRDFFEPLKAYNKLLDDNLGPFAFLAAMAIYVAPGAFFWFLGTKILDRYRFKS